MYTCSRIDTTSIKLICMHSRAYKWMGVILEVISENNFCCVTSEKTKCYIFWIQKYSIAFRIVHTPASYAEVLEEGT